MVKTLKSFEANDAPIVELEVEEKESSEKFLGGFKVSDGGLTSEELRERVSFTQANVLDINLEKNRYDVILWYLETTSEFKQFLGFYILYLIIIF